MSNSNEKKSKQLGMPHGTATSKLRKMVMFALIQKCGLDNCHQCGGAIENVDDLSIEHEIPWLDSDNPVGLFFDLDNISFSHLSCNVSVARRNRDLIPCPSLASYKRGCRCDGCRESNREESRRSMRKHRSKITS